MTEYENFIKTTDLKVNADDDIQFYLDGMSEEHGEIYGVIKRMRRGDYDKMGIEYADVKVSVYLIEHGLKPTLNKFPDCMYDLVKEIGDHHWYETRFLQVLELSWKSVDDVNMSKLKRRVTQGQIIGKGSDRETKD